MFTRKLTEHLKLEQLDEGDASELYNLIESDRADLRVWLNWIDLLETVEDVEAFIRRTNIEASQYKSLQSGILFQNELAGLISFEKIDWINQSAEIGNWLGEKFRGKGISTKTTQAFVDFAFEELNLNRIEIRCGVGNLKSQAVPERLGFQREGILREVEWLHDRYIDHAVYSMTRTDYQNQGRL